MNCSCICARHIPIIWWRILMYHRNNNRLACRPLALVFCALALAMAWMIVQAQEPRGNPEAQKLKNPETNTPESIEAGKKLYQRHCDSCHGPNGKGDGTMALSGGLPS